MAQSPPTPVVDTVRDIYESFASGDLDAIVDTWAPNVELVEPEGMVGSGTFQGAEEILEHEFDGLANEWTAVTVTPERFIAEGETAVAIITCQGTHIETGRTATFRGAHVFDFENGLVRRWTSYADSAVLNAACA